MSQDDKNDQDLPGMLAVAKGVAEQRWPHTMDAAKWAEEFVKSYHPVGKDLSRPAMNAREAEELMLGWFANAIMAGYDTAQARSATTSAERVTDLGEHLRAKGYADVPLDQQPSNLRQLLANDRASETYRKEAAALSSDRSQEERLRYELLRVRASYEKAVEYLTSIYAVLNPPDVAANGKTYRFENPHANECLQALSDAIRAIPEELRTPSASRATNAGSPHEPESKK